jgi:uncharacterized protein YbbC (DUF1343 family)
MRLVSQVLVVFVIGLGAHRLSAEPIVPKIKLGIDVLYESYKELVKGKRVGLITNHTGVNSQLELTSTLLHRDPEVRLVALFAPEHGVFGTLVGGEEHDVSADPKTSVKIYSLYGSNRKPTADMLKGLDVLLFDIQDIGSRNYTYIYTMALAMQAAKEHKVKFVVLDRPNPINGTLVEGNVLDPKFSSFIGMYPIAFCHGMSIGELARMFNEEFGIGCDLTVVPMQGWKREMTWTDTGLAWIPPSPAVPGASTCWYYPTTGIFGELGVINEGVGYTLPFKLVGAPWIDADKLAEVLNVKHLPGVRFIPTHYMPRYFNYKDELLHGVQIIITDYDTYQPVNTGFHILATIQKYWGKHIGWTSNQLTKRGTKNFDLSNGTDTIRKMIQEGKSAEAIIASWQQDLEHFKQLRKKYLLY